MRFLLCAVLAGLLLCGCAESRRTYTFSQVDMVPLGTLQLGDAAFVAPEVFDELGISQGAPAVVYTDQGDSLQAFLYPINRPAERISLKREFRDQLHVAPGRATVHMRLLRPDEVTIERIDQPIRLESYPGAPEEWPGMVFCAPHGDCDMFTGEIVALLSRTAGVPAVAAYGPRISYAGRWIDVNRPLQRKPGKRYGIEPDRSWTDEAESVYTDFRNHVLDSHPRTPGKVPLRFYFDFHGHDLTVTKPDGTVSGRVVCECMARGFRLGEVRLIKQKLEECLRAEYGDAAPPTYWGNLPEERVYTEQGVQTDFFYSGLGARVYGTLGSEYSERCIHIETPDLLRIPEENRPRTARALAQFAAWMRDVMLPDSIGVEALPPTGASASAGWIALPGGEYVMGAGENEGWSSERPQRRIMLAPFEIMSTEVTNSEFASFLRDAIQSGAARPDEDRVLSIDGVPWATLWPDAPHSCLSMQGGAISVRDGFEQFPIVGVTWYGANAFAESRGARLPTEAEWEYAANWDTASGRPQRWIEKNDPACQNLPAGNYMHSDYFERHTGEPGAMAVGSFPDGAGPNGMLDAIGNVWEWTSDWYAGYPSAKDVTIDPKGPDGGTMKVIRGGAWDTEPSVVTPVFRLGVSPHQALPTVGIRLAR